MQIRFDPDAYDEFLYWLDADKAIFDKAVKFISEIRKDPIGPGSGKAELLKNDLSGWRAKRLNHEHRFVYRVKDRPPNQYLEIFSCRYHY